MVEAKSAGMSTSKGCYPMLNWKANSTDRDTEHLKISPAGGERYLKTVLEQQQRLSGLTALLTFV